MSKINNTSITIKNIGVKVTLYGFVANKRKMGEITFIDLRDFSGVVQLVFHKLHDTITKESVLKVTGKVVKRKDKNPNIPTGEIEINVDNFEILSPSKEQLPFVIRDDHEAKEEHKLKYRYLDLRREKNKKIFITRHKVVKSIRDFLDGNNFLEIETPLLSKSTPEGARDYVVPTRKENKFFALPQSPQLYKQLLMIGGFERYFQIARVFRDEDSRRDRQPEFTQLDIELAFSSKEEIQDLIEKMYVEIFKKLGKAKFIKTPFQRMNYDDAMNEYGSDKPDLRYGNKLINVKSFFAKSSFKTFKSSESVKMIHIDKVITRKQARTLEEIAKKNFAKGLIWASYDEEDFRDGPGFKFIEKELNEIIKLQKIKKGTLLFVADTLENVNKALGAIRVKLNELFSLAAKEYKFVWIENWPLFEYSEEEKRYVSAHHPFTSPQEEFKDNFDKKQAQAKAQAYDLTLNGFEIGGGSIRISSKNQQLKMLRTLGFSDEQIQEQFGFFINAFDYGVPPHMGIAFGIDRLIMILEDTDSIRDVIAFPKNSQGIAVMEQAPSQVTTRQLDEYGIKIKE